MSDIGYRHDATGSTLYYVLIDEDGKYYNTDTSSFETLTIANWAAYANGLTETPASSYFYVDDIPVAGWQDSEYTVIVFDQAEATPAITDEQISQAIQLPNNYIILKNLQADMKIVKNIPWEVHYLKKGTSTVLFKKQIKDLDGVDITDSNKVVGQHINTT